MNVAQEDILVQLKKERARSWRNKGIKVAAAIGCLITGGIVAKIGLHIHKYHQKDFKDNIQNPILDVLLGVINGILDLATQVETAAPMICLIVITAAAVQYLLKKGKN